MDPHDAAGPRCGCGDLAVIIQFEAKWCCRLCALLLIGDRAAAAYLKLVGEPFPAPGRLIGERPVDRRDPAHRGAERGAA